MDFLQIKQVLTLIYTLKTIYVINYPFSLVSGLGFKYSEVQGPWRKVYQDIENPGKDCGFITQNCRVSYAKCTLRRGMDEF
jgi:hypothetical protein